MLLFIFASLVFATETPDVRVIVQDGKEFVCFLPRDAQSLLQLHLDFPTLKSQSEKLESLNVMAETENARLQSEIDELYLEIGDQRVLLDDLDKQIDSNKKWYSHPVFYAITGFLTGVVAGAFVVHFSS